jgi:hypothetical protein
LCKCRLRISSFLLPSWKVSANSHYTQTHTIYTPAVGDLNPDFLLLKEKHTDNFTDTHYGHFIRLDDVQTAIGADANSPNKLTFDQCDSGVKARFSKAGGVSHLFFFVEELI